MGYLRKAEKFGVTGAPEAGPASAVLYRPTVTSEVRIRGTFGAYHVSWDGEIYDLDLPALEISDGPYMTFRGALRAARRKVRKDRTSLNEEAINAQWDQQS